MEELNTIGTLEAFAHSLRSVMALFFFVWQILWWSAHRLLPDVSEWCVAVEPRGRRDSLYAPGDHHSVLWRSRQLSEREWSIRFSGNFVQHGAIKKRFFIWRTSFLMRKRGDSNPRYGNPYVSLANWWFQPLTHTSLPCCASFFRLRCKGRTYFWINKPFAA